MDAYSSIRKVMATLALVLTAFAFISAATDASDPITYRDIPYNSAVEKSVDLRVDQSRNRLQVSLLSIGLLWGLVLAKRGEARIVLADKPEICLFTSSSLLLLTSVWMHSVYIERVASAFSSAGKSQSESELTSVPDIFSEGFDNIYKLQLLCLVTGALIAVSTLFSAHRLKRSR